MAHELQRMWLAEHALAYRSATQDPVNRYGR